MSTTYPESGTGELESTARDFGAEQKFESGKDHAAQAAREVKEAALLKAREFKGSAIHRAEDVRARYESKTRENPTQSLAIAFGVGFVAGLIFRR